MHAVPVASSCCVLCSCMTRMRICITFSGTCGQVLIADFFFVCAALAWLVAGVGANATLQNSVGGGESSHLHCRMHWQHHVPGTRVKVAA